jgi:hypothetical protein
MTASRPERNGQKSADVGSHSPRGPTPEQDDALARASELQGKGSSKARGVSRAAVPLATIVGAFAAVMRLQGWVPVIVLTIVLTTSIVVVALGPTISSRVRSPNGEVVRQQQLSFARRAPLPPLRPPVGSNSVVGAVPEVSGPPSPARPADPLPSSAEVRAWARQQGMDVKGRGPLPGKARLAWDEAHPNRDDPVRPPEPRTFASADRQHEAGRRSSTPPADRRARTAPGRNSPVRMSEPSAATPVRSPAGRPPELARSLAASSGSADLTGASPKP